ncbi:MAG: hypothetical protein ACE5JH_04375 [Acidobacteriota bacterium]
MSHERTDTGTVEDRLRRLEKRARLTTIGLLVALALAAAGLAMGRVARAFGTIEAGEVRARVVRAEKVVIHDLDLVDRVLLTATDDGAGIALYDLQHRQRGTFAMTTIGPIFTLRDESGKTRVRLYSEGEQSALVLGDAGGRARVALAAVRNGPSFTLTDPDGDPRVRIDVLGDGPTLRLTGASGETLFERP